jgi:histidine triad (HIT) family protein
MAYAYDDQNIFAKILRGEIPNDTVMETEHTLAFNDIRPQSPVHVLVIPKGCLRDLRPFRGRGERRDRRFPPGGGADHRRGRDRAGRWRHAGYRTLSNAGEHAVQEVPHYHMHILAGRPLGRMLQPA